MIEECKIKPTKWAVYAIENGHYAVVLYLLQHKVPVTANSMKSIWNEYRFKATSPEISSDIVASVQELNINVSPNDIVSFYIRLMFALLTTFNLPFISGHLQSIMMKLWDSWIDENVCRFESNYTGYRMGFYVHVHCRIY